MRELVAVFAAVRFFTRIPVPAWVGHAPDQLNQAARYLTLVGILVGAIGAAVTEGAALLLPATLAILLGMAATLLATGAFHEDGLADSCDGFGGGWDKARVLAIMKDSRIGSFGAIALVMALLLKFTALSEIDALAPPPALALALIAGHAASRLGPVLLMRWLTYARLDEATNEAAKSAPLAATVGNGSVLLAAGFALAPCVLLDPTAALYGIGGVLLVTALAGRYFQHRIGGYTGDCLGATQQVAEIAFYLGLLCVSI